MHSGELEKSKGPENIVRDIEESNISDRQIDVKYSFKFSLILVYEHTYSFQKFITFSCPSFN